MANLISIGQLIDRSWDHYSAFFKQLMKISLWAFILPALMIIRMLLVPSDEVLSLAYLFSGYGGVLMWVGIVFAILVSAIAVPAITIWIYINLVKAIESQNKKKSISFKELRKYGWKTFFSYLWVAILKALITALPLLLLVPGIVLIFSNIYYDGGTFLGAVSNLIMLVGVVAALVLMIMLGVKLGFSAFERLIANKRGIRAVKGSYRLVHGRFWKTFWRLLITKIVFGIGAGLLHVIIIMLVVGIEFAFFPLASGSEAALSIVSLFLETGVMVLTVPIFIIVDYFLYDSLIKTR